MMMMWEYHMNQFSFKKEVDISINPHSHSKEGNEGNSSKYKQN